MANKKAVYSACVAGLGFVCFIVGAIAVGLPVWGYYYNPDNQGYDQGYFGPWRTCKQLLYKREKCGQEVARFRPSTAVYIAGVVAAIGVSVLGLFCMLSVIQMAMISSKEKVVMRYSHLVMLKLALALMALLLSIASAGLFAIQIDDRQSQGFIVTRGEAFYVQILCIGFNCVLFIVSIYDVLYSRRDLGDPTQSPEHNAGTTINNPGFKERGVSMTDASGRPYTSNGRDSGSVISVNTTATELTATSATSELSHPGFGRSPQRSSLKKPRRAEVPPGSGVGAGIQNPGYSGHSPPMPRNGSQKKVRIQTHSTEV